jgi:hypothetical protein
MKSKLLESGVGSGDQLYNHVTLDPGLVKGKTGSVFSTGQHSPRFDGAMAELVL